MNKAQAAALLAALEAEHGIDVLEELAAARFLRDAEDNTYSEEWTQVDALREWLFGLGEVVENILDN